MNIEVLIMANEMIGQRLRDLRNRKGYTQQDVADMLHLKNKSTLGSWEIGKSEPDALTFLKLCDIYEVEDIMLSFTGKPSSNNDYEDPGITLYKKLDEIDKSEVRGTMKQMLKAPKYDKNSEISGATDKSTKAPQRIFNIAARDGKNYTVELDEEKAKDFQKLLEKDFPDLL